jgi:uncharacterized membrane protein YebE (DUF533 family)
MKTNKITLVLLAAITASPLLFTSCASKAGTAAAGAATYAAYDNRQDEQKKEDYAKAKKEQAERKSDRR